MVRQEEKVRRVDLHGVKAAEVKVLQWHARLGVVPFVVELEPAEEGVLEVWRARRVEEIDKGLDGNKHPDEGKRLEVGEDEVRLDLLEVVVLEGNVAELCIDSSALSPIGRRMDALSKEANAAIDNTPLPKPLRQIASTFGK
jgi:hypothetical protein